MKPYKYISINLHIALEPHRSGRVHATVVERLPTIDLDTGAQTLADTQLYTDDARSGEAVILLKD